MSVRWENQIRFNNSIRDYLSNGTLPGDMSARRFVNWLDRHYPESRGYTRKYAGSRVDIYEPGNPSPISVLLTDSQKPQGPWTALGTSWNIVAGNFTNGKAFRWDRRKGDIHQLSPVTLPGSSDWEVDDGGNLKPPPAPLPSSPPPPSSLPTTNGFFPAAPKGFNLEDYVNVFVTLDTETGPGDRIVSLAAITVGQHAGTGKWERLDDYQRYYIPNTKYGHGLQQLSVTGYTKEVAQAFRKLQNAQYSKEYNDNEMLEFYQYLKKYNANIVGQNIINFDIPHLFPGGDNWGLRQDIFSHSTVLDTLDIARAFRPNVSGFNKNDDLFKIVTGKSMAAAGLTAHGAHPDAVATGLVYIGMMQDPSMGPLIQQLKEGKISYANVPKWSQPYIRHLDEPVFSKFLTREAQAQAQARMAQGGSMDPTTIDTINNFAEAVTNISMEFGNHAQMMTEGVRDLAESMALNQVASRMRLVDRLSQFQDDAQMAQYIKGIHMPKAYVDPIVEAAKTERQRKDDLEKERQEKKALRKEQLEATRAETTAQKEHAKEIKKVTDIFKRGRAYNFGRWASTGASELQGINTAVMETLPSALKPFWTPMSSLIKSGSLQLNMFNRKASLASSVWDQATGIVGKINPVAGAVMGGLGAVSQIPGAVREYRIGQMGDEIQRRLYLLSSTFQILDAPLRLFSSAIRGAGNSIKLFIGYIKSSMGSILKYGTPWTPLTGVAASGYAASRYADYAFGLQTGATNSSINNWASSQMGLYTMGEMSTSRLIASAMLGEFSNVYANGGDTQAQYNAFMDNTYRQMLGASGTERQRLMWLASQVDSNAPQILSRMEAINSQRAANGLSRLSYSQVSNPSTWNVYSRPLNGAELANNYVVGFQYQAQMEQWNNSKMRLGAAAWSSVGNPAMNIINKLMDSVAIAVSNGNWAGAFKQVGDTLGGAFSKIKEAVAGFKDSSAFSQLSEGIVNVWTSMKPRILTAVGEIGQGILNVFWTVAEKVVNNVGTLFAELGRYKLDFDWRTKSFSVIDKYKEATDNPGVFQGWTGVGRTLGINDSLVVSAMGSNGQFSTLSDTVWTMQNGYKVPGGHQMWNGDPNQVLRMNLNGKSSSITGADFKLFEEASRGLYSRKWDNASEEDLRNYLYSRMRELGASEGGVRALEALLGSVGTGFNVDFGGFRNATSNIASSAIGTASDVASALADGEIGRTVSNAAARVEIVLKDGNGQLLTSLTLDEDNQITRQNILNTRVADLIVSNAGSTR